MNKVKTHKNPFRLSDLFLFLGFIPFAVFALFTPSFIEIQNPHIIPFNRWLFAPVFLIGIGFWITYIILEKKRNNLPRLFVSIIFFVLTYLLALTIMIQPNNVIEDVVVKNINVLNQAKYGQDIALGDVITVSVNISFTHKVFFSLGIIQIMMLTYIALFIFPRRFSNMWFLRILGYILFVFVFSLILFSYIKEHDKYIPFLKYMFTQEDSTIVNQFASKSYIVNKNAYGMCLLIGIIFCCINHSITKRWPYYLLIGFFYINMFFSYCRTGLVITTVLIFMYIVLRIVTTFKKHKIRNIVLSSLLGVLILTIIGLSIASVASKGVFLPPIQKVLIGKNTVKTRTFIWMNSFQLLRNGYWLIGRGYGTFNEILLTMNIVNGDNAYPAHSSFVGLLSEGGIFYLLGFFSLLGYMVYAMVKSMKKDPTMTIAMSFGVLAFFAYSFIEEIFYLVNAFMIPVFIWYHVSQKISETQK